MKTVIIKSQAELDALPEKFEEFTVIEIRSPDNVWIKVTKARDSSRVEAWGSSQVEAWDSSQVVAWDSSRVVARGSSQVEAWDSSRVVAWDSSRVVARGSSQVEAWDSSQVEAWDSSQVEAWGSSRVVAWDSSRVECFDFSMIAVFSAAVMIQKLMDYSVASLRDVKPKIEKKSKTATVIKTPPCIERSFKEWLAQGHVHADGITKKLISSKKVDAIEVFTVEDFLGRKESFVAKRGDTFSHGETVEKAIEGLRYKLSDRDTSKFKRWRLEDNKSVDEIIQAYRAITGACEFGVKQFCEGKKLPNPLTIKAAIELTKGQYGSEQFEEFFKP
jgi:hypothetical protein